MNNSPEQAAVATMPEINGQVFTGFEMREYQYQDGRKPKHIYGLSSELKKDGTAKKVHISNTAVLSAYGYEATPDDYRSTAILATSENTTNPGDVMNVAEAIEVADAKEAVEAPVEISRPARGAGEAAVAAAVETKGIFMRLKNRIFGERPAGHEQSRRQRRQAGIAIGALVLSVGASLGFFHDSSPRGNAAAAVETTTTPANKSTTTNSPEATTTTSPSANEAAKTSVETQASLDSYHQKIAAIGLQNGQYIERGPNDVFPGPIEADQFSLNHGADAWATGNYARNLAGAKQMGAELLAGTRHFTQSDGQVSHDAMSQVGHVPEDILKQLAANNWNGIDARVITVNSPVYQNMTFNNNGHLQTEALRTGVGNDDAIMIITYKNAATGKFESFASRVDCSGFGQVFEKVTVPTPPTPPETPPTTPETPTTTPNKTTTTTVPKSTTTSTVVRTTTTIPGTTTTTNISTTTTPTTIVHPTTTLAEKDGNKGVGSPSNTQAPDPLTGHEVTTSTVAPVPTSVTLPANGSNNGGTGTGGHQPSNG